MSADAEAAISNHTIVHVTLTHTNSSGDDPERYVFVLDSVPTLRLMMHKGLVKHAGKSDCRTFNRNPLWQIDTWVLQFIETGNLTMSFRPGVRRRVDIDCEAATLKVKGGPGACIVCNANVEQLLLTRIDELLGSEHQ